MKTMSRLIMVGLMAVSGAFAGTPIEKLVPVDHVYVPNGFDSNDNVEVVVTGFLPNLCHKSPSASVKFEGKKVSIEMNGLYYHESNPFCPEMVVPFTKTVTLGVMDKGDYEITVNGKSPWEQKETIKVAESTSSAIDQFHYAYVNYINKEDTAEGTVELVGYNPSDCFELDSIEYVSNGKDAYSVLPKMKQVSEFCPMKMVPFKYEWKVPTEIQNEKVLLHVRAMDGNSVNTIYMKK